MTTYGVRRYRTWMAGLAVAVCLALVSTGVSAKKPVRTALDRYVATPDPTYRYSVCLLYTSPSPRD